MSAKRKVEKRRFNRVSILQDTFFDGQKSHPATNISEGGLFISTPEPFYLKGSVLDLQFRVEEGTAPISARAEVIHIKEGEGLGVRFLNLSADDRDRIRKFIEKKSK